ncbi:hypothetical protein K1T71_014808 [Dendrolimus kikuchii]|nr:hypothetical protein K1T71_014808 [Dendrolimus kikuchii]
MSEIETEFHRELEHGNWLMRAAKDKKNAVCGICYRMQPTQDHLLRHIKTVHFHSTPEAKKVEREIFFCNACSKMFFNKVMLSWHIFYTHSGRKDRGVKLDCTLCLRRTGGKQLWTHSLLHNFSSFTTCPFCFDNFKDQLELQEHITKHTYLLRCDICLFDAKTRESYDKHLREHSTRNSNNVNNYDRYFMKTTECKYVVEAWLKGIPIPNSISICVLCREICSDEESKKNHIFVDHGIIETWKKTYMCACGEDFFNGLLLRHHVWKMKGNHRALDDEEEQEVKEIDIEEQEVKEIDTEEEVVKEIDTEEESVVYAISARYCE